MTKIFRVKRRRSKAVLEQNIFVIQYCGIIKGELASFSSVKTTPRRERLWND
jgi:hypothetical protein